MFGEIDLDVVVVKKNPIEISNRLENSLLRYEKKSPTIGVSIQYELLPRRCDCLHNLRRKRFSGLYVDADTHKISLQRHCGDCNVGFVSQ